jgi:hypothetical protein
MHWWDGLRLKRRKRWDRVDAKMVDSRFVARKLIDSDGSSGSYEVREYMVDVPGRDGGEPVRLTFKERTYRVLGQPKPGRIVPVVVNAKRTKVMFNLADPRIDEDARLQATIREREEKENARFEAARRKKP